MASDNGRWAARVLEKAWEAEPKDSAHAHAVATAGVGFALLAIADAIEAHTEEIKKQRDERY